MNHIRAAKGFTLIELLVVIAIIAILSSIALFSLNEARVKARDAARKVEVSQIGRILTAACPVPTGGAGEYDLSEVATAMAAQYPQYAEYIQRLPHDPSVSGPELGYRYIVTADNKCALYANLERSEELSGLSVTTPTPGGGTGVLTGTTPGINGSLKYFQVSN